jgi:Ser/Thr protein kinase RdoA (MazF antagonist)
MAERVRKERAVTLLHNDAHPANVLLPRAAARDGARLVDWSACTMGLAPMDVAYALLWLDGDGAAPAAAAPLLDRYRARLGAGYPDEELNADMRLAVELQLLRPLRMFANGAPPRWCAEVLRRALFMARAWTGA